MSEGMIERVARALCRIEGYDWPSAPENQRHWFERSLGAIEAMREPTWEMASAALGNREQHEKSGTADKTPQEYVDAWYAMIDAALILPAGSADRAGVPLARD